MLDVAVRKADGSTAVDWTHVGTRTAPPLPVAAPLRAVLPDGLRRGSTISVSGSLSLLLALLGAASADGAWCALVGFGSGGTSGSGGSGGAIVSAEAAREYGIDLRRLALVPVPPHASGGWTTAVGALLDAVDIVAARPPAGRGLVPGDVRRLAARARSKDAVLMPYTDSWAGADVRLTARAGTWTGLGGNGPGSGRLRARHVRVEAGGRGPAARPRSAGLWLPAEGGGLDTVAPVAPVRPVGLAG